MIAVRFLYREDWEARLRYYGCTPLQGKGPLNTAEWWQMPWGSPFTVPIEIWPGLFEQGSRFDKWNIRLG